MNNELKYYYNLDIKSIIKRNNSYYFNYQDNSYILTSTDRSIDELLEIYEISNILVQNGFLCHIIIKNINNEIITSINERQFILMQNLINSNERVSLNEIINFSIKTRNKWMLPKISRTNWSNLWAYKIQNLEYQISQLGRNNQMFTHCFGYYAGIVENNIQMFNEIYDMDYPYSSVCHKRLTYNTTLNEFYNPLNFIIDCSTRDVSEYLKSKLIKKIDILSEIDYLLKISLYNEYEKKLFMIRILFPSYQLDVYENCFFENNSFSHKLEMIIYNNNEYEKNIKKIYVLFNTYIKNIPYVKWLDNR